MQLTSPAFTNGSPLPALYTCKGQSINPPLTIKDVPPNTHSLVLIMHDPDAIGGQNFLHWSLWNIPPTTTEISENSVPTGAQQGTNDYKRTPYGPPCPPPNTGTHHYTFDLYALDTTLSLPTGTDRRTLESAFEGHTLATAQIIGTVES